MLQGYAYFFENYWNYGHKMISPEKTYFSLLSEESIEHALKVAPIILQYVVKGTRIDMTAWLQHKSTTRQY